MNLNKSMTKTYDAGSIFVKFICVVACAVIVVAGVWAINLEFPEYSDYYASLERGDCLMISTKLNINALEKPLKVSFLHEKDRVMFFEVDGEINSILRNSDYNRIVRCSDIGSQGALL